jgi:transcriptional regulator with XRE-family HTH domain
MTPEEFRAWRKRLGLTQAQAAEALGRSRDWVAAAETGRRPIDHTVELACWAIERRAEDRTRADRT